MVNFVRVCPFCRSRRIEPAGATAMRTGTEITNYECLSCGKTFPPMLALEVDESLARD